MEARPEIDLDRAVTTITRFLTGKLLQSGLDGYVVGVSGGLDSAVAAALAVAAVGPDKVLGLLLPYRTSSAESLHDARLMVERLGIPHRVIDISPMIDAYYPRITDELKRRAGNKMAR
ncbi:MAG TPA: NAD(+) synthase, partial [candidate division Zixibacteria bacterium]|nr:NAD(+) synthase [candidate division Zixibacteria bacterium]